MSSTHIKPVKGQTISEGDVCIIYISEHMRHIFSVKRDEELQTKFGLLKANELIGHNYGHKFDCKKGWVIPLKLTPELWTQLLPHRTQVLYLSDISLMLLYLKIKPGSIVVESGTGSGSMSHSILRAIRPHGYLHTFEFNKSRADEARREFVDHGYADHVTVTNSNACLDGFGDALDNKADACLLDLPNTWDAVWAAHKALKASGWLCTFSPCIEQVQNNVSKMTEMNFEQIQTFETLMRPLDVRIDDLRTWDEATLADMHQKAQQRLEALGELNTKRLKMDCDEGAEGEQAESNQESAGKAAHPSTVRPTMTKYVHGRQPLLYTSHSGFLTFATKRG